jgi:hypothetical protein
MEALGGELVRLAPLSPLRLPAEHGVQELCLLSRAAGRRPA